MTPLPTSTLLPKMADDVGVNRGVVEVEDRDSCLAWGGPCRRLSVEGRQDANSRQRCDEGKFLHVMDSVPRGETRRGDLMGA